MVIKYVTDGSGTHDMIETAINRLNLQQDYDKLAFRECLERSIERFIWNPHFFFEFSLFFLRKVVILHKI